MSARPSAAASAGGRPRIPMRVALGVAAIALSAASLAGCGRSEIPSRAAPSYESPGGELRLWAPRTWFYRRGFRKSWRIDYRAAAEAAARQRHALAWMSAEYVPERTEEPGATLFRLMVFTTAGYESLAAEPGMPAGTPIAVAAGRVCVASIPTMSPYTSESWEGQQFDAMRMTLDTLRAAVRLSGAEGGTNAAWGADTVTYSIRLPAADAPGREIRARFAPDGNVTWTTTYFGKGWPILERATWRIENGKVTLAFGAVGSGGPAGPLTYAIADSALVPVAWPHEAWGAIGAPLLVYRPR